MQTWLSLKKNVCTHYVTVTHTQPQYLHQCYKILLAHFICLILFKTLMLHCSDEVLLYTSMQLRLCHIFMYSGVCPVVASPRAVCVLVL